MEFVIFLFCQKYLVQEHFIQDQERTLQTLQTLQISRWMVISSVPHKNPKQTNYIKYLLNKYNPNTNQKSVNQICSVETQSVFNLMNHIRVLIWLALNHMSYYSYLRPGNWAKGPIPDSYWALDWKRNKSSYVVTHIRPVVNLYICFL